MHIPSDIMNHSSSHQWVYFLIYFVHKSKGIVFKDYRFFQENRGYIFTKIIILNDFSYPNFQNSYSEQKWQGRLYSSVAEHWSRKPGVVSSNLTGGSNFVLVFEKSQNLSQISIMLEKIQILVSQLHCSRFDKKNVQLLKYFISR